MTLQQFAAYCQVQTDTVRKWITRRKLSSETGLRHLPGGGVRVDWAAYDRAELEASYANLTADKKHPQRP